MFFFENIKIHFFFLLKKEEKGRKVEKEKKKVNFHLKETLPRITFPEIFKKRKKKQEKFFHSIHLFRLTCLSPIITLYGFLYFSKKVLIFHELINFLNKCWTSNNSQRILKMSYKLYKNTRWSLIISRYFQFQGSRCDYHAYSYIVPLSSIQSSSPSSYTES